MAWRNAEWRCKLLDHHDRWISASPLDIADIGPVDACAVSIIFLAPAFGLAQPANVLTKAYAYIHAELKTRLSPINLQTISHIDVDFAHNGSLVSLMIDTAPTVRLRAARATFADLQPAMLT